MLYCMFQQCGVQNDNIFKVSQRISYQMNGNVYSSQRQLDRNASNIIVVQDIGYRIKSPTGRGGGKRHHSGPTYPQGYLIFHFPNFQRTRKFEIRHAMSSKTYQWCMMMCKCVNIINNLCCLLRLQRPDYQFSCQLYTSKKLIILSWYNNITMTQKDSQNRENKREYSRIPIKKRMMLVREVLKKGKPLAQIIQQLNIKITTARFIINKYKESGTFPRRKFRRNSKKRSTTPQFHVNDKEFETPSEKIEKKEKQQQIQIWPEPKLEQNCAVPFYVCWYYYPLGQ